MTKLRKSIGIVGSGTAGLVAALLLRKSFPHSPITVISSSSIGIIGVGEGSTEHWRMFMDLCEIPLEEMLVETMATHKYGIRYEGWTNHTPDYFHSISASDDIYAGGYWATYMGHFEKGKMLTSQTASIGLIKDKISREGLHKATNQYHFDTNKLNDYFISLCFKRNIKFVDGIVAKVDVDRDSNTITSVTTKSNDTITADFWFDGSGFNRVLMNEIGNSEWQSFSDYLLCNTAIPFPTESDPNKRIRPYTRARAASSGWMWEIPTQERRGNGYVFSSEFISEEQAVFEAEKMSGYKIENPRVIKLDAGYLKNCWVGNCCAIGLASSFVEPLEATSIGSTIQQIRMIIPYVAAYEKTQKHVHNMFNDEFRIVMENILTMIRLHYYSDRSDTEFWRAMKETKINSGLQKMIDVWGERPPLRNDFSISEYQLFHSAHFSHVAQGQGIINKDACSRVIESMSLRQSIEIAIDEQKQNRNNHVLVDHAEALRELHNIDNEWNSK
jgi:tryptophan halogenase